VAHEYAVTPMDHQVSGLRRAWKKTEFALFWEMGTGKTFTAINLAIGRYQKQQIDSLIVICPTPIKLVWEAELEKFCMTPYACHVLSAGKSSAEQLIYFTSHKYDALKVVIVGVEALSQGNAHTLVLNYARLNKCMVVADESSRLKNADAERTKRAIKIASECYFRMIMTGTPVTQGIHDLYGQFQFLNPKIIGCKSYFQFRNMYCVMGGFEGRNIIGYQNTDDLMKRVSQFIDVVKKEDVLDLPPKVYERIIVEPTKQQLKAIESLKDTFEAQQEDKWLITETILERLTRFQQIIGGNFPFNEEEGGYGITALEGPNPKMDAVMNLIEELPYDSKVIIWARFVPEIELIRNSISKMFPNQVVTFYGKDDDVQRKNSVQQFQDGNARFIVSNPQLGGMGQTWTAANTVIYYSNSFSYEDRKQSEDRAHRKGQTKSVTYIDVEVNHRYDKMILSAIRNKGDVAKFVDEKIAENQEIET
jgi:SNF2 family DNA or RNA helicase